MVFTRTEDYNFRLLYLAGGSVHGISQAQVLVFMEELTGIPIAWQYDMISGDSVGSNPAAVLNCPKERGSIEPKFTAREYAAILKDIVQETFEPYRDNYYKNMVALEIEIQATQKVLNIIRDWAQLRDQRANNGLSGVFNYSKNVLRKIGIGNQSDEERSLSFFNLHSGITEKTLVPILEKRLKKAKERAKDFFFSADKVHATLDEHLRFDDGTPVMLKDSITGFHSEAFNINNTKPEAHIYMKPIDDWDGFISHEHLPLAEIPKRSMPAQTVFKPYYSKYSNCHYDDIAHHNTMASPMNAIRRKLWRAKEDGEIQKRVVRKGVSIGTGMEPPNIDPERMGELLILGRLDASEGAPLLNIPLLFNTSKAIRDLTEELGEENAVFIEKIMDPKLVMNKYKFREEIKRNPDFFPKFIRENMEYEASKMPNFSLIDARPEKIKQIEEFGWDMIWDHLGILVQEAKAGLRHAHKKGYIDDELLQERLEFIEEFLPERHAKKQNQAAKSFLDYLRFGGRLPGIGFFAGNDANTAKFDQDDPSP